MPREVSPTAAGFNVIPNNSIFATTALVATAGVAAADVAVSGYAEMGIAGGSDGAANGTNGDTQFFQDLDVTFTMSGTADNGLTFGASVDIDETAAGTDNFDDNSTTVFISGDFGTLTMGDTDGALDWAMTEANFGSPGSIDDSETLHAGYNGNGGLDGWFDGQVLRYDYSFGDFGIAVSAEQDDNQNNFGLGYFFGDLADAVDDIALGGYTLPDNEDADETADTIWGIGATYDGMFAGGSFGVGIGYQFTNDGLGIDGFSDVDASVLGVSGSVALDSGFSFAANYSMIEFGLEDALTEVYADAGIAAADQPVNGDADGTHMAIGASYTFDAITVHANYGEYNWDGDYGLFDSNGYGVAAAYDFGGGLSAHLAYGYSDFTEDYADAFDTDDNEHSWSFGLAMSF
jgi:outer membrane protein OmpU